MVRIFSCSATIASVDRFVSSSSEILINRFLCFKDIELKNQVPLPGFLNAEIFGNSRGLNGGTVAEAISPGPNSNRVHSSSSK